MENPLDDQLGQTLMMQAVLAAAPQIVGMYPKIIGLVDMLDNAIDDYLEDGKMIVLTKKNGVTLAIVLDTKKQFTLTNEVMLEGKENPVINKYEKSEWKVKVLNCTALQILKERYEKSDKKESGEGSILNIIK